MQTVIQKAASGNRKAMEYLYARTKKKVFYIARLLLEDNHMAESAIIWTYRFGWSEIKTLGIASEVEFEKLVVQRVVGYCKKRTLKKDAKAFHVPTNRNFNLNIIPPIDENWESIEECIMAQFTDLQRYIFVLRVVAKYERKEIEKTVNLRNQILDLAIDAEKKNVESILKLMGINGLTNYKEVILEIMNREHNCKVPERVDDEVKKIIGYIVEPMEKKQKKQRKGIFFATITVCVLLFVGGIFFWSDEETNNADSTENSESVEVTEDTEIMEEEDEILTE